RTVHRVGELHDSHCHCHCAGQEKSIETRHKAGDEQNRAEKLGIRGDVSEECGDVVAGEIGGEGGRTAGAEDFRVAVRDEDQADRHSQNESSDVQSAPAHDRIVTPLALFVSFYLATFWIGLSAHVLYFQWIALISASCASVATITLWHHGKWDLGLRATPRVAWHELLGGILFAVALIGTADILIIAFTPLRHLRGHGFPLMETFTVFIPAALHGELVFRGYPYQLLRRWRRWFAIASSSLIFAALHAGNSDVTAL